MATRKYDKTRLDLHYKKTNETLEFYISDTETSDFYVRLTRANMPMKINNLIVVLCVIDPSNQVRSQFISADTDKDGVAYCKLENSMKSQIGTYQAKVMLVYEDEKIVTDTFSYTVKNDMFVALNQEIIADERFQTLNDMLSEISKIKNQEEVRIVAENERVLTMTKIESQIAQLVLDINSKVNTNVSENTNKTDELVIKVNAKVDESLNLNTTNVDGLIARANTSLSEIKTSSINLIASVEEHKTNSTASIEGYKVTKDSEINKVLTDYKTSTTKSVNSFIEGEALKLRNDLVIDTDTYKAILNGEFSKLDSDLKLNVNNFITTKSDYVDSYLQNKSLELTKYISDKNTELDNYIITKTNELNTNEKTRLTNESRRETNEYSRGLNEVNRKNAEDRRSSEFNTMKLSFSQMIKFNDDGELEVTIDGVTKVFVPK